MYRFLLLGRRSHETAWCIRAPLCGIGSGAASASAASAAYSTPTEQLAASGRTRSFTGTRLPMTGAM